MKTISLFLTICLCLLSSSLRACPEHNVVSSPDARKVKELEKNLGKTGEEKTAQSNAAEANKKQGTHTNKKKG